MKSLVVYSSQTGNTRKLAEALFEMLPDEKEIYAVADAPEPANYDLVAIGFWVMGGNPDPDTAQYLDRIGKQKLFLFGTHGVPKNSPEAVNAMNSTRKAVPKAEVVGTYNCEGELSSQLIDMAEKDPNAPPWIKDPSGSKGHPDEANIREIKELIARVIKESF